MNEESRLEITTKQPLEVIRTNEDTLLVVRISRIMSEIYMPFTKQYHEPKRKGLSHARSHYIN